MKQNTKSTIKERKKAVRSAEILASLDNNLNYPEDYIEAKRKWINGEISDEEFEKVAYGK